MTLCCFLKHGTMINSELNCFCKHKLEHHCSNCIFDNSDFIAEQDSPVAYQSLWLGLTTNDKNQFTWSDDSTFDYNSWAVGEPSDDGKCTVMLSNGGLTNAGDWYNTSCDELWNFVCQTEAQKCPDEKWTYFDRTNACYRVRMVWEFLTQLR